MLFVTSDLHGCSLDKLKQLLEKADFGSRDDDYLFILGDVIDRNGDGGVSILRWLMEQPNAELLLGNHEAMLLACEWIFDTITEDAIASHITSEKMNVLSTWMNNGAEPTMKELKYLMKTNPYVVNDIFAYLKECPLYETVSVGEQDFILTHAGLGNFSPNKKLSAYTAEELLWTRPECNEKYFEDVTVVFGHTPTIYYGLEHKGKILFTQTWIDIDTGGVPTLLRLEDMVCFQLE